MKVCQLCFSVELSQCQVVAHTQLRAAHVWQQCSLSVVYPFFRIEAAASKWWFYIYSVVESFTNDRATESSAEELIKTFQKFMEQSTLGEYGTRLNILFTFHCHVVHRPKTACRGESYDVTCPMFCLRHCMLSVLYF